VLLIGTLKVFKSRINKWVGLITSLVSGFGISYLILFFPERLPLLATESAVITPLKMAFEYFIIAIFIVVLWNTARNSAGTQDAPSRYIILAVMFVVLPFFQHLQTYSKNYIVLFPFPRDLCECRNLSIRQTGTVREIPQQHTQRAAAGFANLQFKFPAFLCQP